jgi:hypothetical protein
VTQCLQHRFRQDKNLVLQVLTDQLDIDTMEKPEPMTTVWRPAELVPSDFMEAHHEITSHKRQPSRALSSEPPCKSSRSEPDPRDEALSCEAKEHDEVFLVTEQQGESAKVFVAIFSLKKKLQTELHHSNNPIELQEAIDEAKVTEWWTLQDEK